MKNETINPELPDKIRGHWMHRQPSQTRMIVVLIDDNGRSDNVPTTGICDVSSGYTGDPETSNWSDWLEDQFRNLHGSTSPSSSHIFGVRDPYADLRETELRTLTAEPDIEPIELPPFEKVGRIMGKPKPVRRLELLPGLNR